MMHMTFYWGKGVTLLFDEWITRTWLEYSLSLLALFIAGVVQEWLSQRRARLAATTSHTHSGNHVKSDHEVPLLRDQHRRSNPFLVKALDSLLFAMNTAISYLLMLAIMSFNGGVFISVVLGHTVGYYVFHSGSGSLGSGHSCA